MHTNGGTYDMRSTPVDSNVINGSLTTTTDCGPAFLKLRTLLRHMLHIRKNDRKIVASVTNGTAKAAMVRSEITVDDDLYTGIDMAK